MNVLILTASTGGGHIRTSEALKKYFNEKGENINAEIIDTFKYINPILDKTVTKGYLYLAKKTPKLYGKLYNLTNEKKKLNDYVNKMNYLFSRRLLPLLEQVNPDVIISTHPFSTEMIAYLKSNYKINIPLICIMTDYAYHKAWIQENVNAYIVSNDEMISEMIDNGVERQKIYSFGIPIDDEFYKKGEKSELLYSIGFDKDKKTILMMAGSFGVTNVLGIYKDIMEIGGDFQVIIITGKNKRLYEKFEQCIKDSNKKTELIYFTEHVAKYMQCCDIIITKPGGLTVTEALACNVPLVIFDAIPGQEEENADFLIKNNMAVKLSTEDKNIKETIENLLDDSEKLIEMKNACKNHAKNNSCKNILKLISTFNID